MKAENIETREDYYEYVNEIVDILEDELKNHEINDKHHFVEMSIDSDKMIMYYSYHMDILQLSDNEPQEWKHLVGEDENYRQVIQAMAYDVFRQDIYEEISDRDISLE